jgi:hypothetical protein
MSDTYPIFYKDIPAHCTLAKCGGTNFTKLWRWRRNKKVDCFRCDKCGRVITIVGHGRCPKCESPATYYFIHKPIKGDIIKPDGEFISAYKRGAEK